MVVADGAPMKVAPELQEVNVVCASGMEAARDARGRTAKRVLKVSLVSASLMEVGGAASFQHALRVHKEAQCCARHMVGARGA